ncbi:MULTISPECIES: hypothetical protein [unclassified Imperialibacter]|uniref:hypothetical protein n=1 Tax=unclassified Imperialibacter TaxID=2629706 RepID=UPI001257E73C|nr:hypothetical protein IMPERIA75_10276 [Imperialibacter sp. 75]CAD5248656.1 hypothetical protein IMPERIA89_10277 [Imperialibacter sp. 89]VVS97805.1 hypothetical protein IMPR6_10277 [Imperialibacter sp. EC-SDR9]
MLKFERDNLGLHQRKAFKDRTIIRGLKNVRLDGRISIEDGVDGMDQLERSVAFVRRKMAEYWQD